GDLEAITAGLNEPAIAALWRRGIQLARYICRTAIGDHLDLTETNRALLTRTARQCRHGAGLDDAGVIELRREQLIRRLRSHDDLPAIRSDRALVFDQCVQRAFIDCDIDQRIAAEVQRDLVAGRHRNGAEIRGDDAIVRHRLAEQRDTAAAVSADLALIDNR